MAMITTPTVDVPRLYRLLVVWEAAAVLRHDLRNKLASVRNASFYIRRKMEREAEAVLAKDARLPTFFDLISSEIAAADTLVSDGIPSLGAEASAEPFALAHAVDAALAHLPPTGANVVRDDHEPVRAVGSLAEITIAIFCVIENAIEADSVSRITVTTRRDGERAILTITDDGGGLVVEPRRVFEHYYSTKPGRLGLGCNIARRMLMRSRGTLALDTDGPRGVKAVLTLPGAEPPS